MHSTRTAAFAHRQRSINNFFISQHILSAVLHLPRTLQPHVTTTNKVPVSPAAACAISHRGTAAAARRRRPSHGPLPPAAAAHRARAAKQTPSIPTRRQNRSRTCSTKCRPSSAAFFCCRRAARSRRALSSWFSFASSCNCSSRIITAGGG